MWKAKILVTRPSAFANTAARLELGTGLLALALGLAACDGAPSSEGERNETADSLSGAARTVPLADIGEISPQTGDASELSGATAGSFPTTGDLSKDGTFKSTTLRKTGPSGKYTVYLPQELGRGGVTHPIVGWMSGGGSLPSAYPLLPRLATHGFVVVAAEVSPGIGQEVELGKQILAGIEWAIAENTRSGSPLFGKLNTSRTASIGYSMGALASFTIASDPRITTTVHISGGNQQPERVKNLRNPAAFICGTPNGAGADIAAANCDRDFRNATTPVFYANFKGGHLGIRQEPTATQITTLTTTWLRWKLMDDGTLASTFVGPQCEACTDPAWKVQQKNLN